MLAVDVPSMPLPPLRLLNDSHRLALHAHDGCPARKQSLIKVMYNLPVVCIPLDCLGGFECVVSRSNVRRAVQAEDIAGFYGGHEEGEADCVSRSQEVGTSVDVGGDVVCGLRAQEWQ